LILVVIKIADLSRLFLLNEVSVRMNPMAINKKQIEKRITEIEALMSASDFWTNKTKAQETIREYDELKDALAGVGKYDKGGAILTILSGA